MGWDRKGNRFYYSRSKKVGGRVIREYIGTGPLAQLAAKLDAEQRARREAKAAAWRAEKAQLEALDGLMNELHKMANFMTQATLTLAGYHQHNRGEWRRRRETNREAG